MHDHHPNLRIPELLIVLAERPLAEPSPRRGIARTQLSTGNGREHNNRHHLRGKGEGNRDGE